MNVDNWKGFAGGLAISIVVVLLFGAFEMGHATDEILDFARFNKDNLQGSVKRACSQFAVRAEDTDKCMAVLCGPPLPTTGILKYQ